MNTEISKEQTEEAIHMYIDLMVDMIHDKKMEVISFILKNHLGYNETNNNIKDLGNRITRVEYKEKPEFEFYYLDYETDEEEFIMEWHTIFDSTENVDQPVIPRFEINAPIKLDKLF